MWERRLTPIVIVYYAIVCPQFLVYIYGLYRGVILLEHPIKVVERVFEKQN